MNFIKKAWNRWRNRNKPRHFPKISQEDKQYLYNKAKEIYDKTAVESGEIKKKTILGHYKVLLRYWRKCAVANRREILEAAVQQSINRILNITIKGQKEK